MFSLVKKDVRCPQDGLNMENEGPPTQVSVSSIVQAFWNLYLETWTPSIPDPWNLETACMFDALNMEKVSIEFW